MRIIKRHNYFCKFVVFSANEITEVNNDHSSWDMLIFTQQWPITSCYDWEKKGKSHKCLLPSEIEFWTIHGIWPTRKGEIGPNFCNKSAEFDVDKLQPIMDDLEEYWPNIHNDSEEDSLWKHEWLKHGTCALELPDLNNEVKYFDKGINWRQEYLISDMLGHYGIHPGSNNTVVNIHQAIVSTLDKNPSIHCIYDQKTNVSFLSEIRICFDRELNLIHCDGAKLDFKSIKVSGDRTVNTNCHVSYPVYYPSAVPPVRTVRAPAKDWLKPVVNIYKLINFIMWLTL